MNRKAKQRTSALALFILVIYISQQVEATNWFLQLIDPKISIWDSVIPGNTELYTSSLAEITGYVGALGDINNDKL
jgi:hypothetical protein